MKIVLVFVLALCTHGSRGISWNSNWAFACDFKGQDLQRAKTTGEKCGGMCAATGGCTHFTWTGFEGGTCWMKSGPVSRADAFYTGDKSMVCGIPYDCEGYSDSEMAKLLIQGKVKYNKSNGGKAQCYV